MSNDRDIQNRPGSPIQDATKASATPFKGQVLDLEQETKKISKELNKRITYWEIELNQAKKRHPRHLEIMSSFLQLEKEFENQSNLEVLSNEANVTTSQEEMTSLFDLLDKEISTKKRKPQNIHQTFSHQKTIDGTELENEFKKYEKQSSKKSSAHSKEELEDEEESLEESYEFDYEEFHNSLSKETKIRFTYPSNAKVVGAFLVDTALVISGVFTYFFFSDQSFKEKIINNSLPKELLDSATNMSLSPQLISLLTSFELVLFSAWIFGLFFFSVLYDGTPGQKLFGITICSKDGSAASIRQLLLRFLCHTINILTLGIRPILMLLKKNGSFCRFSQTCLAITKTLPKESDSYSL